MFTTPQQKVRVEFTLKTTLAATGLLLGLALTSPAAAVQCGDTIGPNQTVTFQANLFCDDNTGGLTVIGPAEVQMNGYAIWCQDTDQDGFVPIGLRILGQEAQVHGYGVIADCTYGVYVEGQGRHTVENIKTQRSHTFGFLVESAKNMLRRNTTERGRFGFNVGANSNTLIDNVAILQDEDGFLIDGHKHQLRRNYAYGNEGDGFNIYGKGHKLSENRAENSGSDGFDLQEGDAKKVTLHKNLAILNRQDGFQISGHQHKLVQNGAYRNQHDGIQVHDASHIKLIGNEALDNNQGAYPGIFDLKDLTPNCNTNTWKDNTFGTASQPCIQ